MNGLRLLQGFEVVVGAALIALTLLDVFLTVLYARIGSGLTSRFLACWLWRAFRAVSSGVTVKRDVILSFCGPVFLVALVLTWMLGFTLGAAMIIHPALGHHIRASQGQTPTDFLTAMYIAGDCLTTVGASDFTADSSRIRIFYTLISFIGISTLTLTLTYFLEIYNALQQRNTFALKLHMLTAETGDAAEFILLIGPEGKFDIGYTHLIEIAGEATSLKESHHFYPALFYCRFKEVQYALSRVALITLDTVTLIKSGLDDERYGWLKKSAAVEQMFRSATQLMSVLAIAFLPGGLTQVHHDHDDELQELWKRRYRAAVDKLREGGIETYADPEEGAEIYVSLRMKWDSYVRGFAEHLAHDPANIDLALSEIRQGSARATPSASERVHATG